MQPSRLTFRDKCPTVCWQKQLRDKHLSEGTPPVPHLEVKKAIVRKVSRNFAKQIIYKYEWLGTMATTSLHYGMFFGDYCAGVCCVAVNGVGTAGPYVHRQFHIKRNELATLARGACVHWSPIGSNSKLVSWTCKLLKRDMPGIKIIIAYSDTDAGEIGTIYQSCNWFYIGIGKSTRRPDQEIISPQGRVYNHRIMSSIKAKTNKNISEIRKELKSLGWREQPGNPKHRYVQILDKKDKNLINRIKQLSKPYPKRVPVEVATHQDSDGSSTLTHTLQL